METHLYNSFYWYRGVSDSTVMRWSEWLRHAPQAVKVDLNLSRRREYICVLFSSVPTSATPSVIFFIFYSFHTDSEN